MRLLRLAAAAAYNAVPRTARTLMGAEHIEPDYATAAEAWMTLEMTMASMRYRDECIRIAAEYERRLTTERAALIEEAHT